MSKPAFVSVEFARAEEAALWCQRFCEGRMTREAQRRFAAWLDKDPENGALFELAANTWQEVHAAEAAPDFLALRVEALESLQRRHRSRAARLTNWSWGRRAIVAASVLLVIAVTMVWWVESPTNYATGLGERRIVELSDGSRMSLDAATRVTVRYTQDARSLQLVAGRAKFDVTKDPLRPFSVTAADRVVVATGTEFSVELVNRQVEVILYEGHVSVLGPAAPMSETAAAGHHASRSKLQTSTSHSLQELSAGHVLDAAIATPGIKIASLDKTESLEWEAGQLEFVDEPLASAIERMNRYPGPRLSVADAQTAALRISGVFSDGETRAFIEGITAAFPVQVETEGNTQVFKVRGR